MTDHRPHKSKPSVRDMRKDLRAIYEREDGTIPDMSKFSPRKKSKLRRFLIRGILVLLAVSALAWSGFFFFSDGLLQTSENLSVKITSPATVKSGEAVSYAIAYENVGDVPIAALELAAKLPLDFHLTSTIPEAQEKQVWKLGSLSPKSDGVVTIHGIFLAEVPSTHKLQALFTYKPANFNSSFQTIKTQEVEVNDSILDMNMNGPASAKSGDDLEYVITVANKTSSASKKDVPKNLRVIPNLPQDFVASKIDPAFEQGNIYWNLASLDPNQPKTFRVKGSYSASAKAEQTMSARVGFVSDDVFLKQKEASVTTSMQGDSLALHLIVNGSSTNLTIDPNKTLKGSIDYANDADVTAEGVSFTLALDGKGTLPIDWAHADLKNGIRNGNEVVWDASKIEALKRLKSKDAGVIDFSLPLSVGSKTADHFTMTLTAHVNVFGESGSSRTLHATPILVSVNAEVGLRTEARYFTVEGMPVGSGPLPPTVGKTTTYRVYWHITNALHDLSNVTVTTTLPANVMWTNKNLTDIGTLTYKHANESVTWTIPKLPKSISEAGAWFDVWVKPTEAEAGSPMTLTSSTTLGAKDANTSETISKPVEGLTTNLVTDEFASGKGTVQK